MRQASEKYLRTENKKWGDNLQSVPREKWPEPIPGRPLINVYRSNRYLVQEYTEPGGTRLSICRTALLPTGDWDDGLTWDELMEIKRQAGYPHRWAYECYPPESQIVNIANMRHLFIPDDIPDFGWHS